MILKTTDLTSLKVFKRGKVRDVYEVDDKLLIVATDRISAFDVVLPTPVPYKGELLNQLSLFWFDYFKDTIDNHIVTSNFDEYPESIKKYGDVIKYRSVLVKKAKPLPVECIVRGYISGSGWKEYQKTGSVCGIGLPSGLKESDRLPEPVFTPSTKAEMGEHDENISFEKMTDIIGKEMAERLKELSLNIYIKARDYAETKGIIIADTKFEFGLYEGKIILIDEILTPDSSRFWPKNTYTPGKSQVSLDKQYIRDYLVSLEWEKKEVIPELPFDVVRNTFLKYKEAYEVLTGKKFRVEDIKQ
ncbi:MAG: phosphoribosylaminoimidazolesuccinocarboxamide synthase [Proteobacteria bacterium]|nr:phosphoribosylaminoimidazolesuccinocarboxamide synthase [Pseudomonadota bacterium]